MALPGWLEDVTLGEAVLTIGLLVGVWAAIRHVWPMVTRLTRLLDEVLGEPPHNGRDRRPGWGERLAGIEAQVKEVDHQVRPNSGTSAYDAHTQRLLGISEQVATLAYQVEAQGTTLQAHLADVPNLVARAAQQAESAHVADCSLRQPLTTSRPVQHDDEGD